ncbi:DUF3231 family protein [Anaeroselena agilis]|uniref:DUF3231 family protein n=1 Tax=Anaeroselena agilis TaxID=3063788 RepID=A0ABU3P4P2_9FIRM|nr:DUF3231 family protein [Selenomonadales bacterium 4137-cl]
MTITDKLMAQADTALNMIFDKEPPNQIEAAALYASIMAGRQNVATLAVLYNHARDTDLKAVIKRSIDEQTEWLTSRAEKVLAAAGAEQPALHFMRRNLVDRQLDIPEEARFSDQEIALLLANMAKTSQLAVLGAMHNCYQPNLAKMYQDVLDKATDFNYRLMQLTLTKGWLPHLHKLQH